MRTQTKETQQELTPKKALDILMEGNQRFVNNSRANRNLLQQVSETSNGQFPFAVILSCIDSRTSAELIFDQGMGDIFSVRIAGNVVNEDILGSMEFACQVAGSKLVMVLGHSKCGAVKGACSHVELGNLTGLLDKIQPSVEKVQKAKGDSIPKEEFVEEVAVDNVLRHMDEVLEQSDVLRKLYEDGQIGIIGAMYSVDSGEVEVVKQMLPSNAKAQAETSNAS